MDGSLRALIRGEFKKIIISDSKNDVKDDKVEIIDDELLKNYLIRGLSDEKIASEFLVNTKYLNEWMTKSLENDDELRKLINKRDSGIIKQNKIHKNNEKQFKKVQKISLNFEKKIRRIFKEYFYNDENVRYIKDYLEHIKSNLDYIQFDDEKLDLLEECMEFIQADANWIKFYTKICISQNAYERAKKFIDSNIYNESISSIERTKLRELQSSVSIAIKKEEVVRMIYNGITDTQILMKKTNLKETEVLEIKRNIKMMNSKNSKVKKGEER